MFVKQPNGVDTNLLLYSHLVIFYATYIENSSRHILFRIRPCNRFFQSVGIEVFYAVIFKYG